MPPRIQLRSSILLTLILSLLHTACATAVHAHNRPRSEEQRAATAADNKQLVLDFYNEALVELHPRSAFERYASADFIEHKPDVPGGTREATITFLESLIAQMPQPHWEILRTVAEGDLVFLHVRFSPAEGALPYAIADLFRISNGRIVEHWDVVSAPPKEQPNPHSRF